MRLRVTLLTVLLFCLLMPVAAHAENPIHVYIDGEPLDSSFHAQVIDDRTFVPIRAIAENWGATVGWNSENQQVRIQKDRLIIDLFIDKHEAVVDKQPVYSDAVPLVVEGRTIIPLRFVGEILGAHVRYDSVEHAVMVTLPSDSKPDENPNEEKPEEEESDENDLQIPDGFSTLDGISVNENQIILQLSAKVQPEELYLNNPDRIVLDLPKTILNIHDETHEFDPMTNQGKITVGHALIQSVRYSVFDAEKLTSRVVVDLTSRGDYNLTYDADKHQLIIHVLPGKYKIVLDAGHGGTDPGAKGYAGNSEKWFNLSVAKKMASLMEKEPRLQPLLSRSTDDFITLQGRVEYANNLGADLFMSIHANAFTQSTRGTETYYYNNYSKSFGETVHRHLVAATGFNDRGLHQKGFYVIKHTQMPAVLIESGFLTNPTEEKILFTDEFQDKVALAMVNAIKNYLGL